MMAAAAAVISALRMSPAVMGSASAVTYSTGAEEVDEDEEEVVRVKVQRVEPEQDGIAAEVVESESDEVVVMEAELEVEAGVLMGD